MASLLSLLMGHNFRLGRRDLRVWSPNPLEGFSCQSVFHILIEPSPVGGLVYSVLKRIKIMRKSEVLLGKFYMANTMAHRNVTPRV